VTSFSCAESHRREDGPASYAITYISRIRNVYFDSFSRMCSTNAMVRATPSHLHSSDMFVKFGKTSRWVYFSYKHQQVLVSPLYGVGIDRQIGGGLGGDHSNVLNVIAMTNQTVVGDGMAKTGPHLTKVLGHDVNFKMHWKTPTTAGPAACQWC
jgi:hypothetical protein